MTTLNKQALRKAAQEEIMLRSVSDTSDAWQDEASPEAVLALRGELEAVERQNGYLREQRDEWERKAISNFEECLEMATRIEELESQRQMAFMATNRWSDKFREAEKRIAELEARTVKLPTGTEINGFQMLIESEVIALLREAGINVTVVRAAGIGVKGE